MATIDTIVEEKLAENAEARGTQLMSALRAMQKQYPVISDVRGLGLMVATEFRNPQTGEPDPETTAKVSAAAKEHKMLMLVCGSYKNVLRWIPPLVVTEEQIDNALDIFAKAMREVVGSKPPRTEACIL